MTDEPIAWLYEHGDGRLEFEFNRWPQVPDGWTETPLYGPEALAARDARTIEALTGVRRKWAADLSTTGKQIELADRAILECIEALAALETPHEPA